MQGSMKKAGMYYMIGNLFNKGMSFLTVPIFTRILSTSDYGIVTTYNSWISILSMVMGFAIYMGIRSAFIDYEKEIDDFVAVSTTFTILSGAILSFLIGFGVLLIRINVDLTLVVLCLLQGISSALTQNYSMYLQMKFQYKSRTALMILPNLLSVILSILAILYVVKSDYYMGRIVPTAMVYILFGFLVIVVVYHRSNILWKKEYLVYALKISAPLVVHGIALNILSQSDRTMITVLVDSSQTGIYSLIYNFSMIATVVTTSLDGVWVPWFMRKLKEHNIDEINMRAKDYINLITCLIIAVMLVGPEVVKVMAPQQYWEGILIIPPIVLANYMIFAYTLYVNVEHYYKKTPYITVNTVIAAVINLGLNFLFIPKEGYFAAAYTTLVAYVISFVLHARYAKKLEDRLYPLAFFVKPIVQLIVAVIIFYVCVDIFWIRWVIMIVYLMAMLLINRDRIKLVLQ